MGFERESRGILVENYEFGCFIFLTKKTIIQILGLLIESDSRVDIFYYSNWWTIFSIFETGWESRKKSEVQDWGLGKFLEITHF